MQVVGKAFETQVTSYVIKLAHIWTNCPSTAYSFSPEV